MVRLTLVVCAQVQGDSAASVGDDRDLADRHHKWTYCIHGPADLGAGAGVEV